MKTLRRLLILVVLVAVYVAGDFLGLPNPVRDAIRSTGHAIARLIDGHSGKVVEQAQTEAGRAGEAFADRVDEARSWLSEGGWAAPAEAPAEGSPAADPAEAPSAAPSAAPDLTAQPQGAWTAESAASALYVCPGMTIQNGPRTDADGRVQGLPARVRVGEGVRVATVPVRQSCLASGYGFRGGKLHKGLDFHHKVGVPVRAAASGVIREATYRDDYGNMVVIDHGQGAFTRYAHLRSIGGGIAPGATVAEGAHIGVMGRTAGYSVPIHLHYEILTGTWAEQAGSFGLDPVDPFSLPEG